MIIMDTRGVNNVTDAFNDVTTTVANVVLAINSSTADAANEEPAIPTMPLLPMFLMANRFMTSLKLR